MSYSKLSTEEPSLEEKEEEESISDKLKVDLITSIIPKTKLYTFYICPIPELPELPCL